MTYLVERLVELRKHLDHLGGLRGRVVSADALETDLTLHNDVLFSLLTVCQLVIDVAGDLAGARGARYEDYASAIRALKDDPRFPPDVVDRLVPLAGFRDVLIHEHVALDLARVVEALDDLGAIERFAEITRSIVAL